MWMKEIICFAEVSYQINIELRNRQKNPHNATFTLFFSPSTHKSRAPVCFQVLPKFKSLTQCQPSGALKGLPLRPEFAHRCCYTPLPQRHLPDQSVSAVAARASRYVGKGKYLPLSRRGWSKDPKQLQVITDLRLEAN